LLTEFKIHARLQVQEISKAHRVPTQSGKEISRFARREDIWLASNRF
jgi:hypothetical protein